MVQLYTASLIKSMFVYTGNSSEIIRICNEAINKVFKDVMPPEIINGKQIHFINDACYQFRYNYVVDS